jgi:hypothetical protein
MAEQRPRRTTRRTGSRPKVAPPPPSPVLDGGRHPFYEGHFRRGGFVYDVARERAFLRDVLIPVCGWGPGARVIEIGAGQCLHSGLLAELGMDVTAVEVAEAGAAAGRAAYPGLDVVCADAARYVTDRPGSVFARGISWYHYELDGVNQYGVDVPGCTRRVWRDLVAPGAVLAVQMVTDLTGSRPVDGKVHQNRLADYLGLFGALGGDTTVTDWSGQQITAGKAHDRGVLVVTRKPGR